MDRTGASHEGTELGRFLRARRDLIGPEEAGLPAGTGLRRTPGLRREELATLAGVSVDYYTRLERGRETRPSPAVITSIGRALRLSSEAMQRLRELAALAAHRPCEPRPVEFSVRPSVVQLLETVRPSPAYVVSRTNHVLAANRPGRRLNPGLWDWPLEQRNLTRYMFLHPEGRRLYQDWEKMVGHSVAHLRSLAGADPDQPELATLVGELLMKSPEFARVWERYEVEARGGGVKVFQHPDVGEMELSFEVMTLSGTDGQRLVVYQATPGGRDHDAMLLLDMADPAESTGPAAGTDAPSADRSRS